MDSLPTKIESMVIWDIRFPRVLLGVLVGSSLAVAGALMQGLFRNPLADPGIIGVTSGGAVGASIMIVLGSMIVGDEFVDTLGAFAIPLAAITGAFMVTLLIYRLSLIGEHVDIVSMLLIGIAINALAGALIGIIVFMATDEEVRTLTFWGLGSLARGDWHMLSCAAPFFVIPLLFVSIFSKSLNALLLGEEEAMHLGIEVSKLKKILILTTASLVGAAVSLTGSIGFIALVVPHIIRSIATSDHRLLLPAAGLLGASLLVLSDIVARTLVSPAELPIGILTALLGAPVFLSLLIRRKRQIFV
jgi:iron complex transport system permease protein